MQSLLEILTGPPLPTKQIANEKLNKIRAMAAFSPDALSSIAYANQEIYLGLVVAGSAGLGLDGDEFGETFLQKKTVAAEVSVSRVVGDRGGDVRGGVHQRVFGNATIAGSAAMAVAAGDCGSRFGHRYSRGAERSIGKTALGIPAIRL